MTFEQWLENNGEYIAQADDIENVLKRTWDAAQQARSENDVKLAKGFAVPNCECDECATANNIAKVLQEQP